MFLEQNFLLHVNRLLLMISFLLPHKSKVQYPQLSKDNNKEYTKLKWPPKKVCYCLSAILHSKISTGISRHGCQLQQ